MNDIAQWVVIFLLFCVLWLQGSTIGAINSCIRDLQQAVTKLLKDPFK